MKFYKLLISPDDLIASLPKCPPRWISATEEQTPRPSCTRCKKSFNHFHFQENRNLMNSSSETPPSPLMSSASKSSLARRRGSNLAQSRSGSRTWFLNSSCNIWWEAKLSLLFFFIVVYCILCWHVTTSHARLRPGQPRDTPESRLNLFPPRSDLQEIQEKSFQ